MCGELLENSDLHGPVSGDGAGIAPEFFIWWLLWFGLKINNGKKGNHSDNVHNGNHSKNSTSKSSSNTVK